MEPTILTAEDIAALRTADDLTAHYYEGRGYIRAYLREWGGTEPRIFSAREQRMFPKSDMSSDRYRDIETGTTMRGYSSQDDAGDGWFLDQAPEASAFQSIWDSDLWGTIAGLLVVGDSLTLAWRADNNNEIFRNAGLHADELRLVVSRPRKTSQPKTLRFLLSTAVTPDNSARMIHRYGVSVRH